MREYNLKYQGLIGSVFHTKDIDAAIEKVSKLALQANGSSAFDVVITELVDGVINVLHAEEYPTPDFNQTIEITVRLPEEYEITFDTRCRIFVDGANPSFIIALKERLEEDTNYEHLISYLRKQYPSVYDLDFLSQNIFVIPIPFSFGISY